jgi:hypothetical protein
VIKADLGSLDWVAKKVAVICLMEGQRQEGERHLDLFTYTRSCALSLELEFLRTHTVFASTSEYYSTHHVPFSYF